MRIIHIEDFFHPDAGYQVNVLSKYQVRKGYEVTIMSSEMSKIPDRLKSFFGYSDIQDRDRDFTIRTSVNVIRVPILFFYSGRAIYTFKLFKLVNKLKPDIIFVHGNDSFAGIIYTFLSSRLKYPVIMDNHMLEMATSNKFHKLYRWFYRKTISPIIVKNEITIIRMVNDDFIISNLGIPLRLTPVISFGTDLMQFHPDENQRHSVRKKYNIDFTDFVVLYMGKLSEDKGVLLLANACKEKFKSSKKITIVVVGNVATEYGKQVEETLISSENKVLRFPTQKYQDLPDFYLLSDLVVFPKQCSLSFFDAQACGIPVIAEDNSINSSRMRSRNGLLFRSADESALREKIQAMAAFSDSEILQMKQASLNYIDHNKLDYEIIAEEYNQLIEQTITAFK
jgi:glycosyltransferase involved in cell wall biosynthesis